MTNPHVHAAMWEPIDPHPVCMLLQHGRADLVWFRPASLAWISPDGREFPLTGPLDQRCLIARVNRRLRGERVEPAWVDAVRAMRGYRARNSRKP